MAYQFILYIILLLGRYSTEFDLLQQKSLHYSYEYAIIIGNKYDMVLLKDYSKNVFVNFIKEQLIFSLIQY